MYLNHYAMHNDNSLYYALCFAVMHNGTDIFLMYNGKYETLCENNFNKQLMANELCKLAGKG